jgi:hypothetical protein
MNNNQGGGSNKTLILFVGVFHYFGSGYRHGFFRYAHDGRQPAPGGSANN